MIDQFDIAAHAPELHKLSKVIPRMANVKPHRISFNDTQDKELVHLLELFGGNANLLWAALKKQYGSRFEKRCRDHYKLTINKHEFTKEEDKNILKMYREGYKPVTIARLLGICSFHVKHRIKVLLRGQPANGTILETPPASVKTPNETNEQTNQKETNHVPDFQINFTEDNIFNDFSDNFFDLL